MPNHPIDSRGTPVLKITGTVLTSTDVAIDLQSGLTVQTPKSIVRHFFGMREIPKQAHQYRDDPGIVLKKNRPELSFVPMLR